MPPKQDAITVADFAEAGQHLTTLRALSATTQASVANIGTDLKNQAATVGKIAQEVSVISGHFVSVDEAAKAKELELAEAAARNLDHHQVAIIKLSNGIKLPDEIEFGRTPTMLDPRCVYLLIRSLVQREPDRYKDDFVSEFNYQSAVFQMWTSWYTQSFDPAADLYQTCVLQDIPEMQRVILRYPTNTEMDANFAVNSLRRILRDNLSWGRLAGYSLKSAGSTAVDRAQCAATLANKEVPVGLESVKAAIMKQISTGAFRPGAVHNDHEDNPDAKAGKKRFDRNAPKIKGVFNPYHDKTPEKRAAFWAANHPKQNKKK